MVYASLDLDLTQEEVWPHINQKTWLGRRARSYKLAHDALERGLNACVLQIRDPRRALLGCIRQSVRAIINHRMSRTSGNGHYSVLVDADEAGVVLHDPQLGANRALTWPDLEQMWLPSCKEITGHILVVFASRGNTETTCPDCQTTIPEQIDCNNCKKPVLLRPLADLTCWNRACSRCWLNKLFCPHCDFSNLLPAPVS
jgi:hypothetical protein